jgi:ubiquinone/menaquinone biosynthesis C-methylase UbiE
MDDWNGSTHVAGWGVLIPEQSTQPELLDGDNVDPQLLRDNLRDMARANWWLGVNRAVRRRVAVWLDRVPAASTPRVLDVATGGGDLPLDLYRWSAARSQPLTLLASDLNNDVLRVARAEIGHAPIRLLRHDALRLPFADNSIDLVICTQALHHFDPAAAVHLLRELARVARLGVIVNDLRRSYVAYWGARMLALITRSPLSRHDGPLSVLRAYTPDEVREIVRLAAVPAEVRSAPGFRLHIELLKG